MALSTGMAAAIHNPTLRTFYAVRIELPSNNSINLIEGSGVIQFPVNGNSVTFTGMDAIYGEIINLSTIDESVATSAPRVQITMQLPGPTGLTTLGAVSAQGYAVYVWFGLVNEASGGVIGSPELLFTGEIDTIKLSGSPNSHSVTLDVASVWDRLFRVSEGERLNDSWHKYVNPGEDGLSQSVAAVVVDPIWGSTAAQITTTPGVTPGLGGGVVGGSSNGPMIGSGV